MQIRRGLSGSRVPRHLYQNERESSPLKLTTKKKEPPMNSLRALLKFIYLLASCCLLVPLTLLLCGGACITIPWIAIKTAPLYCRSDKTLKEAFKELISLYKKRCHCPCER